MALLPIEAVRDGILTDPSIYPQSIDIVREAALFVRLDQAAFRAASFLDDRMLSPDLSGRWVRFDELSPLTARLSLGMPTAGRAPLHFIFHTGHVGSTLLSRLLDDVGGVLGLREPQPLRTLGAALADLDGPTALVSPARWKELLDLQLACWSRGYGDTTAVVLKATSSTAPCGEWMLDALPEARALLMNLAPEPYLATLLAGENSRLDLRGQAQGRMQRLMRLASPDLPALHALGTGELAALSWTVETLTHRLLERRFGARVRRVDFDDLLGDPSATMRAICAHLAIAAPESHFSGIARSATLTRYSKAPEHAYSPDLRRRILADARARHADEIALGLRWIATFSNAFPDLGAALSA